MPRFVKVTASVYGQDQRQSTSYLYEVQAAQFEVQLLSKIQLQKEFAQKGIHLFGNKRQEVVHVFSSTDFDVKIQFDNGDLLDSPNNELIKYHLSRTASNSNDYKLTVIIPSEVTESFTAKLQLVNPITEFQRTLPVHFNANQMASGAAQQVKQADPHSYQN